MSPAKKVSRRVALLRAINVGGHTVRMAELKRLFEAAGYGDVKTFIASGNVIFDAAGSRAEVEGTIESLLERTLGYPVAAFVRTPAEITATASHAPFDGALALPEGEGLYVGFLKAPVAAAGRAALVALSDELNAFYCHQREVYWHTRTRFSDSTISGAKVERTLQGPATFRNITSVRKLAATLA